MTTIVVARTAEYLAIHQASCRFRAQGLACSTCTDLAERAERATNRERRAAA